MPYIQRYKKNELYRTEMALELDVRFEVLPATLEPDFPAQVHVSGVFFTRATKRRVNLLPILSEEEIASLEADISEALEI